MSDPKCQLCHKTAAARPGPQNRTPVERHELIRMGICRPCHERYLDALALLSMGGLKEKDADELRLRVVRYKGLWDATHKSASS